MKIGIDFDNTIVEYDQLFHRLALESDLIPHSVPPLKQSIRDYLRSIGREDDWTLLQGQVYGAHMAHATPFAGVVQFIAHAARLGHQVYIVSHKTQRPFMGPSYDLHGAARSWIDSHLISLGQRLIPEEDVFFELTLTEKLERISALKCEVFIDDLPEVLGHALMPPIRKFLFNPAVPNSPSQEWSVIGSWRDLTRHLLSEL
jgi:hypothetical protein